MREPRLRQWLWMSWGLMALTGCLAVQEDGTHIDSETHFLRECDDACPEGLECICGVCSVTCSPAQDCSDIHMEASCVAADSFAPGGMCTTEAEPSVCDVVCEADADCADIGDDHLCLEGHCRAAPIPDGGCLYFGEPRSEGESFSSRDGCNECRCEAEGEISCTTRVCDPDACVYEGESYELGERFPASDGCNTCSCEEDGLVACTELACVATCEYGGATYTVGDTFDSEDGCNSCRCEEGGTVACTTRACVDACELPFDAGPCAAVISVYWHNPATGNCEPTTWGGCGGNDNRFGTLDECSSRCGGGEPSAAACLVGGVEYADGELLEPDDCNVCTCRDGVVSECTAAVCGGGECAAGEGYGSACAECGIAGGCAVVETGCLPTCESDTDCEAPRPYCLDGLCGAAGACL